MRVGLCCIGTAAVIAACAGGRSSGAPPGAPNATTSGGNARVLVQSEIAAVGVFSIYEVIERLRPNMLRSRGRLEPELNQSRSPADSVAAHSIKVYVDGEWIGDPAALRGVPAAIVHEVQYLSASDATVRFGAAHEAGALLVTSKYKARSKV